jgi:Ca-activated chloride channel family protein
MLAKGHLTEGGNMKPTIRLKAASLLILIFFLVSQQSGLGSQITVPSRPVNPLYQGEQGKQRSEIEFTPSTRTVTLKVQVEDPKGYFLPNIRRDNFAVYEDGVRQKNVTVEIEHAPISVALLMEFGGRYHELNKVLAMEVPEAGRPLLEVVGRDDKIAVFKYDAKLETLADFGQGHETLDKIFSQLNMPVSSEVNSYDALLETLNRMKKISGRKAVIVITSGIDTFSEANYQQVLQAAQDSATPIYAIGLSRLMQRESDVYGDTAPFARIDWNGAEKQLEALARASGGRAYVPDSTVEVPAIYDDIMENLRVRYVITYTSSNMGASGPSRKIRVELIDFRTGEPLKIRDSYGKPVTARVFVQDSYSPSTPSGVPTPSCSDHVDTR